MIKTLAYQLSQKLPAYKTAAAVLITEWESMNLNEMHHRRLFDEIIMKPMKQVPRYVCRRGVTWCGVGCGGRAWSLA
jgi:hypothetical protein